MASVRCAAHVCVWNKNGKCKSKTVALDTEPIQPRHKGFDLNLTCRDFELSEDVKIIKEELEQFWGVKTE